MEREKSDEMDKEKEKDTDGDDEFQNVNCLSDKDTKRNGNERKGNES